MATIASTVLGHNLDTRATGIAFEKSFLATITTRAATNAANLVAVNDEFWVILKTTPVTTTATGVGGYQTFYVPSGVQVTGAEIIEPDPANPGGFRTIPAHGQSIIAVGAGSVGAKASPTMLTNGVNGSGVVLTNFLGRSEKSVVDVTGIARGTIAGVYADTGIFYSTNASTGFNSYNNPTNPALVNNSGDTVGEYDAANVVGTDVLGVMTLWDSFQLRGFGRSGAAIIDPADQRGNAPWGMASAVAGPQSGYPWSFDFQTYTNTAPTSGRTAAQEASAVQGAIVQGPWNRIQYPGSQVSSDMAGSASTTLGYAGIDGSGYGVVLSSGSPLPTTTTAVRFAIGMLEANRPLYARVRVKVLSSPSTSCFTMYADAFGGDAGGEQGGKDHIWRYFDPTVVQLSACTVLQKVASKVLVAPGETFYFDLTFVNNSTNAMPNVTLTDTLPSGVTHLSSVPIQNSGPNPLVFNLGTVAANQIRTVRVNVQASGSGPQLNTVVASTNNVTIGTANETVNIASVSQINETKSVTPTSTSPGGTVTYTVTISNTGTGPSGTPMVINELLPTGFNYASLVSVDLNGGTPGAGVVTVNSTNPNRPVFTSTQGINAGKTLVIKFTATVGATVTTGSYCNVLSLNFESKTLSGAPEACVTVGGGSIGDTVYRDWNGNGVQDTGEEGIAGITLTLYSDTNGNGLRDVGENTMVGTKVTDANGNYLFTGLAIGNYVVVATPPASSTNTGNPTGGAGNPINEGAAAIVTSNTAVLTVDFGYQPTGSGVIGDQVFQDLNGDGVFNGSDTGIANVTVNLYEDTNGNGVIDSGDVLIRTTTTNGSGIYSFTSLPTGFNYIVDVDETDADLISAFSPNTFTATTPALRSVLNLAGTDNTADFGYRANTPSAIGDTVYVDVNRNGSFDLGTDRVLANVTVTLYRDSNADGIADGAALATAVTDANGQYLFTGLAPDTYLVVVDQTDADIGLGYSTSIPSYNFALATGTTNLTIDFPFRQLLNKIVSTNYAGSGTNLTFSITPSSSLDTLLSGVRVIDPIPNGTAYVSGSVSAGGTFGAYPFLAAVSSTDGTATMVDPTVNANITVSTNFVPTGAANVTVTLNVSSSHAQTGVGPDGFSVQGGTYTVISGPTPATVNTVANVATFSSIVWVIRPDQAGEYVFSAGATNNGATVTWLSAQSASVLSMPYGGTNVVTWNLGTNLAAAPAQTVTAGIPRGFFELRGGATTDFNAYNVAANTWGTKLAYPGGTVNGSGLVGDGTNYLYAFRGVTSTTFYRYDVGANTWLVRAAPPGNISAVGGVGAVFLTVSGSPYIFATAGNGTAFYRYDVTADTWTTRAVTPQTWLLGGSLATDGTNIFGMPGNNKTAFYQYTVALDTWGSALTMAGASKDGGGLAYVNGNVYIVRGNNRNNLYRYNIAGNSFTKMANFPAATKTGSAIASDGTNCYVMRGNATSTFYRYNVATNTWTTLTAVGANPGVGAGLVYNPDASLTARNNVISVSPALVTTGDPITVLMTLTATYAITAITPQTNLTLSGTSGATATLSSGPTLVSADNQISGSGDPVVFRWIYTATAGTAVPNQLTFSGSATNTTNNFATATGESVLTSPTLTFQATVSNSPPNIILNQGILTDDGGVFTNTVTPITSTATSASIGDFVWLDNDADGVQDVGEPGIAGVTVYLLSDANNNGLIDGPDAVVQTAVTDANGLYRFYGATPGVNYTVTYNNTNGPASGLVPTTSVVHNVSTITSGQQYTIADFGLRPPGTSTIGDTVWLDSNENGVVDSGETLIANVDVRLYADVNNNGTIDSGDVLLQTVSTGAAGTYVFTGVSGTAGVPGNYLVDVVETDPQFPTGVQLVSGGGSLVTGLQDVTINAAATTYSTADFGYNYGGQIGDTVFYDLDGNGTQSGGGEVGAVGVAVTLFNDVNNNGSFDPGTDTVVSSTTTGALGYYLFDNLPAGNYIVVAEEQTVPAPSGSANAGLFGYMVDTTGTKKAVALAANQVYLAADFGFIEAGLLEGTTFRDLNHNGILDVTDTRQPDITVWLDTNNNGILDGGEVSTTTDSSGDYKFLVSPGSYIVRYLSTDTDWPVAIRSPSGDQTTVGSYAVTVAAGQEISNLNFGRDNSGKIGDTVFADLDNNGSQGAGEPGIQGVTVLLYTNPDNSATANGDEVFVESQVTGTNGDYLFLGLADGNYQVRVDTSTTSLPTTFNRTHTAEKDATKDSVTAAVIASGGSVLDIDFGYPLAGTVYTISGTVWNDQNNNQTIDAGVEAATFTGVTVRAEVDIDADGIPDYTLTTTTSSVGAYSFANIPSGANVRLVVDETTLPSPGYVQTRDPGAPSFTCPDASCDGQDLITAIGANVTGKNFGYRGLIRVGNQVWNDIGAGGGTANDGVKNGTEPGISGVTVQVFAADPTWGTAYGSALATTTTDASGFYGFYLAAGDYVIVIPASNFGSGQPLLNLYSSGTSTGTFNGIDPDTTPTDNDDNGFNSINPATVGVRSAAFTLTVGGEPTGESPTSAADLLATDNSANLTVDFGFTSVTPTAIKLAYLKGWWADGRVTVEWETVSEMNTLGFDLYRLQNGGRVRVNADLVPALNIERGGVYRVTESLAQPSAPVQYLLVEQETTGKKIEYGPFEIVILPPAKLASAKIVGGALELRLTGEPGTDYRIESTDDLLHGRWIPSGNFRSDTEGVIEYHQPLTEDEPARFYRALRP